MRIEQNQFIYQKLLEINFLFLQSPHKQKMNTHKCDIKPQKNYQPKQRYIPTFVHEQIFAQQPPRPQSSRCNPTFHSTVFDTQGYNIQTNNQKRPQAPQLTIPPQKVVFSSKQKQKLISYQNVQNRASKDIWFDHTKQQIFSSIKDCRNQGYCKERKYVDLSSDPVFTEYHYNNNSFLTHPKFQPVQNASCIISLPEPESADTIKNTEQQHDRAEVQNIELAQKNEAEVKALNVSQNEGKVTNKKVTVNAEKNKQLKLKGKPINQRQKFVQEKPTFTVIRKSRLQN